MRVKRFVLVAAVGCVLLLAGCVKPAQTDVSGATERESLEMTLEAQYELAGARHQELNERFAELQEELFTDQWQEGGIHSEVVPGQGGTRGNDLPGATNDNSYYFVVTRWHPIDTDVKQLLRDTAKVWEARGWEVSQETIFNALRITTTTPEGFWFAADERVDEIRLEGMSPVYWGDQYELVMAVGERRNAENEAGAPWDTTDLDEKGYSYRIPGVFRPFPAWNALDK